MGPAYGLKKSMHYLQVKTQLLWSPGTILRAILIPVLGTFGSGSCWPQPYLPDAARMPTAMLTKVSFSV